jgi:hypothetical protein
MLTVRETLLFAAEFRLPCALSSERKRARVDQLGLFYAADTINGWRQRRSYHSHAPSTSSTGRCGQDGWHCRWWTGKSCLHAGCWVSSSAPMTFRRSQQSQTGALCSFGHHCGNLRGWRMPTTCSSTHSTRSNPRRGHRYHGRHLFVVLPK